MWEEINHMMFVTQKQNAREWKKADVGIYHESSWHDIMYDMHWQWCQELPGMWYEINHDVHDRSHMMRYVTRGMISGSISNKEVWTYDAVYLGRHAWTESEKLQTLGMCHEWIKLAWSITKLQTLAIGHEWK